MRTMKVLLCILLLFICVVTHMKWVEYTTIKNNVIEVQDTSHIRDNLDRINSLILGVKVRNEGFDNIFRISERTNLDFNVVLTIYAEAEKYGYDPAIHLGLIHLETGGTFRTDLVNLNTNGTRDHGLCQINDGRTAGWLWSNVFPDEPFSIQELYDPIKSVKLSAWYLDYLYKKVGTTERVLTAYNRGEQGMHNYIASHGSASSTYSRRVLELSRQWGE